MEEYRTIIHLEINEVHEYYGSPSSLYDKHTAEELGISKASLNNYYQKMTLNYIRIVGVLSEKESYIPNHQLEAEKSKNQNKRQTVFLY